MIKLVKIFIICLLGFACKFHPEKKAMVISAFTKLYYDSLTAANPETKFKIVDEHTIIADSKDLNFKIFVDNAYLQYQSVPDSLQQILAKYISTANETLKFNTERVLDINNVVPVLKPVEYLAELKKEAEKMSGGKDIFGVYEKYNDQLIICYAEDTKHTIRYLTEDDFRSLSIDKATLKLVAVKNLHHLLEDKVNYEGGDGNYMITAGGDYESSIILMDSVLTKENFPVKGDVVVAIPNRDILLLTGSEDKAGIKKTKGFSEKSFNENNHPLSPYLYKWTGKKFEKFE